MKSRLTKTLLLFKYLLIKRYPCVLQNDENDCGAATFATIARHYGYYMNLEQASELVQVHQMGQSVWDLKDAAEEIGLEGRPAHAIYSAIKEVEWPFIAHYGGELAHFVVVYEVYDDYVVVGDPARGIEIQTKEEFEKKWSGYIVEFEPTDHFKKAVITKPARQLFWGIMAQNGSLIRRIIFLSVFLSLIGMASSYFVKEIIDKLLPAKSLGALSMFVGALITVYVVQLGLGLLRAWLQALVGKGIEESNLFKYFEHIAYLPLRFHETRSIGNLFNRMADIGRIRSAVGESLVSLFSDFIFMVAALFAMFLYSTRLTLLVLGCLPVLILITLMLSVPIRRMQSLSMGKMGEVAGRFIDTLSGIGELKIFSAEEYFLKRVKEKAAEYIQSNFYLTILQSASSSLSTLVVSLLTVVLLWQGAVLVMGGGISLGQMMFFFGLAAFVVSPIQYSGTVFFTVQDALVAIERLEGIKGLSPEQDIFTGQKPLKDVRGKIEFQNVTFGYSKRKSVLEDISFMVNPGEIFAIVGETGVGKSTLAKLTCGFYKIQKGTILIDGVALDDIALDSLRENICAVFQRPHLFNENLYRNITMGQDIPLETIEDAYKNAQAFRFIDELPQKYLAQVFSGGSNLSEGQIQRIAILRALTKNSPILIFDEATSNLDSETESAILNMLKKERQGKTTVIIGHRLSTVAMADKIAVLEKGKIVELGTFKELIERRGPFYALFRTQLEAKDMA